MIVASADFSSAGPFVQLCAVARNRCDAMMFSAASQVV
jgi:hypothetical protein